MSDANTTPDPHAVETTPGAFEFSADQVAFLKTLGFHTEFELAHTPKTAPDVPTAFDGVAMTTIASSPTLGGTDRRDQITVLVDQHAKLKAIAGILGPLVRLVSQNLIVTDAALAKHAGSVLKLANVAKSEQPHLLEGLAKTREWTKLYHPGPGAHPDTTPPKK